MIYDEKDVGMDPGTRRYFFKIVNSFSWGFMWLMFMAMAGIYFGLAIVHNGLTIVNIIFYTVALVTFLLLLRYYYRTWKD